MLTRIVGWGAAAALNALIAMDRTVAREVIARAAGSAARESLWGAHIRQRVKDEWTKADKLARRAK